MPIYEYYCDACLKVHQDRRPVEQREEAAKCPRCGAVARRTLGNAGFVLKGAGWCATDFKAH